MDRRVIAAGGGGAAASRPLDELFAQWIGRDGRLLYWPMALPDDHPLRAGAFDWITSVFHPLGIRHITLWSQFHGHHEAELTQFDAMYLGGGNTFRLLHLLRTSGFDRALLRCIERGTPVYGGSAGGVILGRDIGTVAHMDPNTDGVTDLRGLNMLGGYAIWCHYTPADDAHIRAYVAACASGVLAISERAGVALEAGRVIARGYEPTIRFTPEERQNVAVGQPVDA